MRNNKKICYWTYACKDTVVNSLAISDYSDYISCHFPNCVVRIIPFSSEGESKLWVRFMMQIDDLETQRGVLLFMIENDLVARNKDGYIDIRLIRTKGRKNQSFSSRIIRTAGYFINLKSGEPKLIKFK